jgi:two-component system, chemotaxis family, CheB/CheR fusion protein
MIEHSSDDTLRSGNDKTKRFFVVGIGASAGGVDALRQFFRHVPPDCGMAFVVIMHLSAQHESSLPALLQTQTTIPVMQVTKAVKVEPGHIYVIPPHNYLVMADGMIQLTEPEQPRRSHTAIDFFFRSLANAYGKDAVGILLSGSGSDGTLGLKWIKEEAGFVIVQDPSEAEYPEMPRNAINSNGLVDIILPVAEMADKLCALRDGVQRLSLPPDQEEAAMAAADEATLVEILTLLRLRTGHDFTQYKRPTLWRRIARRLHVHQLSDLPGYLNFLRNTPGELDALFRDLLITVTNFFRDRASFEFLERQIIPKLFASKGPNDQVRVWSAGCATGEEAYSLAMLLADYATQLAHPPKLQVFATDIDERAIAEARGCHYPATIALDVAPERLQRFFIKDDDGYRINKELRELVLFTVHDVLRDAPFSQLDLISCRNLLIYLNRDIQRRVLGTFHFALRTDGFLFLGASESTEVTSSLFIEVEKSPRIYSRQSIELTHAVAAEWITPRWQPRSPASPSTSGGKRPSMSELHQQVIESLAPPSVLINEEFDIEHLSAHAGRYLRFTGGEPTRNLLKLIHPDLRAELHAALLEAKLGKAGAMVQSRLQMGSDRELRWLSLTVRPVGHLPEAAQGFFLVIFDDTTNVTPIALGRLETDATDGSMDAIRRLEEELRHAHEQIRLLVEQYETSTEELRASNEELQAINDELHSATEELETSKEELQSVNEELITVNQEHQEKIEQLDRANNDLQNLIDSTDIGTIFLNRSLQIQRYTPSVQRLFNITSADIGRPLEHFSNKLGYDSLPGDAQEVLRTLQTIERELRSSDGACYLARLLPYRTVDNSIDGVVLTLVDIGARRTIA